MHPWHLGSGAVAPHTATAGALHKHNNTGFRKSYFPSLFRKETSPLRHLHPVYDENIEGKKWSTLSGAII